jgi:hypothetical protein
VCVRSWFASKTAKGEKRIDVENYYFLSGWSMEHENGEYEIHFMTYFDMCASLMWCVVSGER